MMSKMRIASDSSETGAEVRAVPTVQFRMYLSMEAFTGQVQWRIMVEMYPKVTSGVSGRIRRAYLNQFDEPQRQILSKWYAKFRRWYFETGAPEKVLMLKPARDIELLKRAVNFFGTI